MNSKLPLFVAVCLALLVVAERPTFAQQILLDSPVRVGELIAFPDLSDEDIYYYVVDKPRLATDQNGSPQFSFLRYVQNVRSGAGEGELREGEGGGVVHALVSLSVTDEQRNEAERELRRIRPGARLQGPVIFRSGKFGLVTSFANPDGGLSTQVVGLGNAPLLDGEKAAVSLQLTKLGAKLLWESFHTAAPDISFTFEMDVQGFRSPKRALIEADFDQIYEHQSFGAGIASTYLAAEIKTTFDDLKRTGAIKLTQVGEDSQLEGLTTTAYNKIAEMMFRPLHGTGSPSLSGLSGMGTESDLLSRAGDWLTQNRDRVERRNSERRQEHLDRSRRLDERAQELEGCADDESRDDAALCRAMAEHARTWSQDELGSAEESEDEMVEEEEPAFAVVATFEMKKTRHRGVFRVDLNKYTSDSLTLRFDENIGDLRSLLEDERRFRQINLDDPLYVQREIVAFVDGLSAADFGDYVNFVSVQLRKRHEGGSETPDEVRIDRNNFNREGNSFKLLYGWKGDRDRREWMKYEYRTTWSFFGGATVEGDWTSASSGAINLVPPYLRRRVALEAANVEAFEAAGVRAITVKLHYNLAGSEQVTQVTLNTSRGDMSRTVEFMAPTNDFNYQYEISWRLSGNRTVTSGRLPGDEAVLFVDELPEVM